MRVWRWLLLAACIGMGGCTTIAAHYIETPGHHGPSKQFKQLLAKETDYTERDFNTAGDLRIAYWYSPPTHLRIKEKFSDQRVDGALRTFSFNFQFYKPKKHTAAPALRGSVVLLHPWGQNAAQMAFWGLYFSNAGYVTVMPALRSQGDSGDAPVGYGPREADDVVQLIHALQRKNELPDPLYLFGVSYGATVALFAAPELPNVRGVIALEPYVHPADVIRRAPTISWLSPPWMTRFFSPRVMQDIFPPRTMDKAIQRADHKLGIDLVRIDPGDASAKSHACTLLLRGSDDILINNDALRNLSERSSHASYVVVPGEGHISLFFRSQRLFPPILDWMQTIPSSAAAPCPVFKLKLPPSPPESAKTANPTAPAH